MAKSKYGFSAESCPRSFFSATDSERLWARLARDAVVGELVGRRQREPGLVGVAVHVVELDSVESGLLAAIDADAHDRPQHGRLADVEPLLAGPAVLAAEHRGRELAGVGSPVLPGAGVHVTDGMPAAGMDGVDGGRGQRAVVARDGLVDVEVDVPHLGADGGTPPRGGAEMVVLMPPVAAGRPRPAAGTASGSAAAAASSPNRRSATAARPARRRWGGRRPVRRRQVRRSAAPAIGTGSQRLLSTETGGRVRARCSSLSPRPPTPRA